MRQTQRLGAIHFCFTGFLLISLMVFNEGQSFALATPAQANAAKAVGLAEGEVAPHFHALDQFGRDQSDTSIAGKNGTVLLFFRSADW